MSTNSGYFERGKCVCPARGFMHYEQGTTAGGSTANPCSRILLGRTDPHRILDTHHMALVVLTEVRILKMSVLANIGR